MIYDFREYFYVIYTTRQIVFLTAGSILPPVKKSDVSIIIYLLNLVKLYIMIARVEINLHVPFPYILSEYS